MAKKNPPPKKIIKKTLLNQIEGKLIESMTDFPKKKISKKKYKRTIRKAGKILATSISLKSLRSVSKIKSKKNRKKKPEASADTDS